MKIDFLVNLPSADLGGAPSGTHSAVILLARELAASHDVTVWGIGLKRETELGGAKFRRVAVEAWEPVTTDVKIAVSLHNRHTQSIFGRARYSVSWALGECLPSDEAVDVDLNVHNSAWQRDQFQRRRPRMRTMPHAVIPLPVDLAAADEAGAVEFQHGHADYIRYASAPTRGVDALWLLWPELRRRHPKLWLLTSASDFDTELSDDLSKLTRDAQERIAKMPGVEPLSGYGKVDHLRMLNGAGALISPWSDRFGDGDTFSVLIAEAALMGCPVVADTRGALPELWTGVAGVHLVDAPEKGSWRTSAYVEAFCDAVDHALSSPRPSEAARLVRWRSNPRCVAEQWEAELARLGEYKRMRRRFV